MHERTTETPTNSCLSISNSYFTHETLVSTVTGGISVLHVDDDPALVDLTAAFLERENSDITVTGATNTSEGIARVVDDDIDCIVSDYDMPEMNGLEFLETLRDDGHELPFILFTGKGSEEIASEAISAGVTDYLQKKSGTEQYTMLTNRIENAVDRARAHAAQLESEQRYRHLVERLPVGITVHRDGEFVYANDAAATLVGSSSPRELEGENICAFVSPTDRSALEERIAETNRSDGETPLPAEWVEFDVEASNGRRTIEGTGTEITFQGSPAVQVIFRERADEPSTHTRLERVEAHYQTLLEAVPDAVFVTDPVRKEIVDGNGAACEFLECTRDDLVGTHWRELCPPGATGDVTSHWDRLANDEANGGDDTETLEGLEVMTTDGATVSVDVHTNVAPLTDEQLAFAVVRTHRERT